MYKIVKMAAIGMIGSSVIESHMTEYDTNVMPPADTISIIIPSYNEESFIQTAVTSLKNQSIVQTYPESFEFLLVDSGSTDSSIELAKPYVDRVIEAPRGKLTARNLAAQEATGNIIVSVDADCLYPFHWLNTLLKPFNDPIVVGVSGSTIDKSITNLPGSIRNYMELWDKLMNPNKMLGRNSAYRKDAFFQVGGFDETIDQLNVSTMVEEEEIGFGDRLAKIGKVVSKFNAACIHLGGYKIACRWGTQDGDSCKGIGTDRF